MLQKVSSRGRRADAALAAPPTEVSRAPTPASEFPAAKEADASAGPPAVERQPAPKLKLKRRRALRPVLLLLGPLLVAVVGGYVYFAGGRFVGTDNAYIQAHKAMVGAEVSGLISVVAVAENERVETGDVLFRIDDRPYRIALDEADAHLQEVRDDIASLRASFHQKEEELALARTELEFAQREYDRQQKLVANNTISRSTFDTTARALASARRQVNVAEQELAQTKAELGGGPDVPVETQPRYRQALAARDRAALDLERTTVRAPIPGIASNTPSVGDQVTGNSPLASPVMTVVGDSDFWIDANFKETDLTYVRPGQDATIRVDSYPGREWHGIVESISQATGAEFSVIPAQNATGNWVKVVQRIPVRVDVETSPSDPPLRAGMSTSVEIDTGHQREIPGFVGAALSWLRDPPGLQAAAADSRP